MSERPAIDSNGSKDKGGVAEQFFYARQSWSDVRVPCPVITRPPIKQLRRLLRIVKGLEDNIPVAQEAFVGVPERLAIFFYCGDDDIAIVCRGIAGATQQIAAVIDGGAHEGLVLCRLVQRRA